VTQSDRPKEPSRSRVLDRLETTPAQPLSSLTPKARRVLEAAQRIVLRDGFDQLSFANIAEEAGVYQSAIRYYFGSKGGLIQALVEASTHDLSAEVYSRVRRDDPLPVRLSTLVRACRTLPEAEEYQSIWELLPHVLRDDELRKGVARLYDNYRSHGEAVFGADLDPRYGELTRLYACLMLAVIEGMAIQKALDSEGVDVDKVFRLWANIVSRSVDEIIAEEISEPV
jgi:AcrR family transcriptional regulator